MNFQFYAEKLNDNVEFNQFLKENPGAYPCSGFFVVDKEQSNKDDKQHFDFFCPKSKKIFSFKLENGFEKVPVEMIDPSQKRSKISLDHEFDFEEIETLIRKKMEQEGIKNRIQKLLFSLQNIEGEDYLVGTVFITGLGMINVRIRLRDFELMDFTKKSFFDFMKILKKEKDEEKSK